MLLAQPCEKVPYLSQLSRKDKQWDKRKAENVFLQGLYRDTQHDFYVSRLSVCGNRLVFSVVPQDNGKEKFLLHSARFCRVPLCPICQGRRGLKWYAKTAQILPGLLTDYPKSRFLMLTLTVRNCQVSGLRQTLKDMHHAWTKMVKRKQWKVQGWIRATEVTREFQEENVPTGYVHPHYHALLMVGSGYFGGHYYLSHDDWTELWQSCLGVDYSPIVDIRAIRPQKGSSEADKRALILKSIREVIKYVTKPSGLISGEESVEGMTDKQFLEEITDQLYGVKKIATGGILKQYFKSVLEKEPEDLIHIDDEDKEEGHQSGQSLTFDWDGSEKKYKFTDSEYKE